MIGSMVGVVQASRAGIAQVMYRLTKFDTNEKFDMLATVRRYEDAQSLYPYNYYFSIWIAEKAYYERTDSAGVEREDYLQLSRKWCDTGLLLSPYNSQLRFLKTRLLARKSPAEAVNYFEKYVAWNFWKPFNHAFLAELCAEAGQIEKAMAALAWVEESPHYESARRKVQAAWQKELEQLTQ